MRTRRGLPPRSGRDRSRSFLPRQRTVRSPTWRRPGSTPSRCGYPTTTWRAISSPPSASPWSRPRPTAPRSEEHTSELQSHHDLVCRLLLEKKKKNVEEVPKIQQQELKRDNVP